MRHVVIGLAVLALAACEPPQSGEPIVRTMLDGSVEEEELVPLPEEQAATSLCQSAVFEGIALTHCTADPALHRITTALVPSSGENFGTIAAWANANDTSSVAFAMSAGAFGDDLRPLGYFVRDEDRLVELDRGTGDGNFYLKPNGVFFGSDGTWRVLESDTFARTIGTRPQFGTQSGPMLVIDGELHPEIAENGPSRAIRNGVGVDEDGKAHFVISDDPLSFGQLARFFRDEIGVPNALFLTSGSSSLWDPATGRMDDTRIGPLLVVETLPEEARATTDEVAETSE